MATRTGLEKAALLLSRLPTETADKVLAELGSPRGERLRRELEKLRQSEATAGRSRRGCPRIPGVAAATAMRSLLRRRRSSSPRIVLPPMRTSPCPRSRACPRCRAIHCARSTCCLRSCWPRCFRTSRHTPSRWCSTPLDSEKAGEILRQLTPEMRRDVSVRLSRLTSSPPELLARIARALIEKARPLAGKRSDTSGDAQI